MDKDFSRFNIGFYNLKTQEVVHHELVVQEGRHLENRNVTWNCDFLFEGRTIAVRSERFLSGLMKLIRKVIEPMGYRALVVCAERNAFHSGMQADMTSGTRIYKLGIENPEVSYHVFDASTIDLVASIQEQQDFINAFYDAWYER